MKGSSSDIIGLALLLSREHRLRVFAKFEGAKPADLAYDIFQCLTCVICPAVAFPCDYITLAYFFALPLSPPKVIRQNDGAERR